jgi:hypothetical protein
MTHPPSGPKSATGTLRALDLVLATALDAAGRIPQGTSACDVVAEELLAHHIRMARRLVRRRAGFALPPTPAPPAFEVGTARPYHASRP